MASPGLPEDITAGVTTGHVTDHEKIHDLLNEFDSASQAQATGDLLVFQDGLIKRLPVGSDNQVLTADSAAAAGVKWATPTGGGGGAANVSFVSAALTSSQNTGNTVLPLAVPSDIQAGDLMILVSLFRNSFQWDGPDESGWTLVDIVGVGSSNRISPFEDDNVAVWMKRAEGPVSSLGMNVSDNGTDGQRIGFHVFRGAVGIEDLQFSWHSQHIARTVKGTAGGMLLVAWCSIFDSGTFDAPPADMTVRLNGNSGFADTRMMTATKALTETGQTGVKIPTHTAMNQYVVNLSMTLF